MDITKEEFEAYEKVRRSGRTNMWAVSTVSALSGLRESTIMLIMQQYSDLRDRYMPDDR